MKTYPVPDTLALKYQGAGLVLAAVSGAHLLDLRYLRDLDAQLAETLDQADGLHDAFLARQWLSTAAAGQHVRELQALGSVIVGMASGWEVCEL